MGSLMWPNIWCHRHPWSVAEDRRLHICSLRPLESSAGIFVRTTLQPFHKSPNALPALTNVPPCNPVRRLPNTSAAAVVQGVTHRYSPGRPRRPPLGPRCRTGCAGSGKSLTVAIRYVTRGCGWEGGAAEEEEEEWCCVAEGVLVLLVVLVVVGRVGVVESLCHRNGRLAMI